MEEFAGKWTKKQPEEMKRKNDKRDGKIDQKKWTQNVEGESEQKNRQKTGRKMDVKNDGNIDINMY